MAEVGAHRHHRPVSHPGAPGRAEHRTNLRPRHEPGRDGDRKPVDSAQVAYRRRREQCARLPAHDVVRGAYMVEMTNRFNPASRRSRRLSNRGSAGTGPTVRGSLPIGGKLAHGPYARVRYCADQFRPMP